MDSKSNKAPQSVSVTDEFIQTLPSKHLYVFRGPFSLLLVCVPWFGYDAKLAPAIFGINRGRMTVCAIHEGMYLKFAEDRFREFVQGKVTVLELRSEYDAIASEIATFHKKIINTDVTTLTDDELHAYVLQAHLMFPRLISRTIYIEMFNYDIANEMLGGNLKRALWDAVSHPYFESFDSRRKRDVHGAFAEHRGELDSSFAKKFWYMYTDYFLPKPLAEVSEELAKLRKEKPPVSETDSLTAELNKFRTTLNADDAKLLDYTQCVMQLRDLRKDPIAQLQVTIYIFACEYLRRAGADTAYAQVLTLDELRQGVAYVKSVVSDLPVRLNTGVATVLHGDGSWRVQSGDYDSMVAEFESHIAVEAHDNMVKGQPASPGTYTGTVSVVYDMAHAGHFRKGDILVTSMTRPEFVPLMKLAGAIVTNEGGVTCHAAIVSRELGIPCVIGTKHATQMLKTGDTVEVRASEGIIKILKRKA